MYGALLALTLAGYHARVCPVRDQEARQGLKGLRGPARHPRNEEHHLCGIRCGDASAFHHRRSLSQRKPFLDLANFQKLLHLIDKKTGRRSKRPPPFIKKGQKVIVELESTGVICMEAFSEYPQLGRFTLRDEGMLASPLSSNPCREDRRHWKDHQGHRVCPLDVNKSEKASPYLTKTNGIR